MRRVSNLVYKGVTQDHHTDTVPLFPLHGFVDLWLFRSGVVLVLGGACQLSVERNLSQPGCRTIGIDL